MPKSLTIRGHAFAPALFCAPMVGLTHCAFRRLLAGFGGYGALFTEMLSARALLFESPTYSTFIRRRPEEGPVIYQLLAHGGEDLPAVIDRIQGCGAAGIDINCGCGAPDARHLGGGTALFADPPRLEKLLRDIRRCYRALLTVKIRLGAERPGWREIFQDTLKMIEDTGADALTLHPRFAAEKLKRRARHELFSWAAGLTGLPLIANGDITGPETIARRPELFTDTGGVMIGRMAAARPWIFRAWHDPGYRPDYAATWQRHYDYILEDFLSGRALSRVKIFTAYYARNFVFGHNLYSAVQSARDLTEAHDRAMGFFAREPAVLDNPTVAGI